MYKEKRPGKSGRKHTRATALFAAAVLAVLPAWTAVRAEAVDLTKPCSLEVEQDDHGEGTRKPDLTVDLYRVAGAEEVQGYDAYTLTAEGAWAGLQKELDEALDKEKEEQPAEAYRELAQKALRVALGIQGDPGKGETVQTAGALSPVSSISLGEDSSFTGLAPGMYLMAVRGTDLTEIPNYVTVLEDGEFATAAYAGGYLYLYSPELIALPRWDSTGGGGWDEHVTATLKSVQSREYVSLKIRKDITPGLKDGEERLTGEDHFVYQIEAAYGGKKVYSNVVMLTMAADESGGELVLPKIVPAGAEITVTEVYAGAAHAPESEKEVRITYARADGAEGTPGNEAAFTNRYTGTGTGGGGIENRFRYGAGADGKEGWNWEPHPGKVERP